MDDTLTRALLLGLASFCAAVVDAIGGGGGLITLPALLAAGLSPHQALGTNKSQSVFGTGMAIWHFGRKGLLDRQRARATFPAGFAGSLIGVAAVMWLRPEALRPVVMVLLVATAVFIAFRRPKAQAPKADVTRPALKAAAIALGLGAYDGFFGPGTGTFLIALFVAFLGLRIDQASADAKVANFASNLAAVALFAAQGAVVWSCTLPMAVAQVAGGSVGARLVVRGGEKLVRRVVLGVVVLVVVKLAFDAYGVPTGH